MVKLSTESLKLAELHSFLVHFLIIGYSHSKEGDGAGTRTLLEALLMLGSASGRSH